MKISVFQMLFFMMAFSTFFLPVQGKEPQSISPAILGALRKSGMQPGVESATIPLEFTFWGFILEIHIDGKPVRLLLDTGAACTALSPALAQRLDLKTQDMSETGTSSTGGKVVLRRALTKRLTLGEAWTENEPVIVTEMPLGVDGLVGVSTLADWDVRIDPSTKTLTLFPVGKAPALEGETVMPLTCDLVNPEASTSSPQGFRMMNLSVPVRVGIHELMVTPDTGHGVIFQLSSALMEKIAPEAMKGVQPGLVTGINLSGKTVSRNVQLPEFAFGSDTLRSLNAEVIEAPPGSGAERNGIIGLNLLRHYVMTFRFSAGELRIKPLGTVQEITRTSTAGIHLDPAYKILSVVPGGAADQAGLRAGDELLEIEGQPLKAMKPEQFSAFKRLPPGSVVKVRYRRGEGSPVEAGLIMAKE